MQARVTRPHEIPERLPLVLSVGDKVTIHEASSEWPAFVFVTAAAGEGWVPVRYFTSDRPRAVTVTPYDTKELAVAAGDVVDVVDRDDESGWWWCRAASKAEGWVPVEVLDQLR